MRLANYTTNNSNGNDDECSDDGSLATPHAIPHRNPARVRTPSAALSTITEEIKPRATIGARNKTPMRLRLVDPFLSQRKEAPLPPLPEPPTPPPKETPPREEEARTLPPRRASERTRVPNGAFRDLMQGGVTSPMMTGLPVVSIGQQMLRDSRKKEATKKEKTTTTSPGLDNKKFSTLSIRGQIESRATNATQPDINEYQKDKQQLSLLDMLKTESSPKTIKQVNFSEEVRDDADSEKENKKPASKPNTHMSFEQFLASSPTPRRNGSPHLSVGAPRTFAGFPRNTTISTPTPTFTSTSQKEKKDEEKENQDSNNAADFSFEDMLALGPNSAQDNAIDEIAPSPPHAPLRYTRVEIEPGLTRYTPIPRAKGQREEMLAAAAAVAAKQSGEKDERERPGSALGFLGGLLRRGKK